MAVTVIGLDGIDGTLGGVGDSAHTLVYKSIATSRPSIDHSAIVSAAVSAFASIGIGSVCPVDASAYCKKIRSVCKNRFDPGAVTWLWETTCTFDSEVEEEDGQELTDEKDPTKRAPRISVSARVFEVPARLDIDGVKVENSAGDPFVRTKKSAHLVYRWERTMRSWNLDHCRPAPAGYLFSRNAAAWTPSGNYAALLPGGVVPIGGAQMQSINPEIRFEDGGCVDVSVEIHVDVDLHADKVIDQGFFHLAQAGVYTPGGGRPPAAARQRFVDRNGVAAGPQNLNGAGLPLPHDADPVVLTFQYYPLKDWEAAPWGPAATAGRFFGPPG